MYALGCSSCAAPSVDACGQPIASTTPTVPAHSHVWELVAVAVVTYLIARKS